MATNDKFIAIFTYFILLLTYSPSLPGNFIHDDIPAILKNKDCHLDETPKEGDSNPPILIYQVFLKICDIFKHDYWGKDIFMKNSHKSYRPVTTVSFLLNGIYFWWVEFGISHLFRFLLSLRQKKNINERVLKIYFFHFLLYLLLHFYPAFCCPYRHRINETDYFSKLEHVSGPRQPQ